MTHGRRATGRTLLVLAAFFALALLFTYPLGLRWWDQVVEPAEDPQLNSWILAWDAHALLVEPQHLFEGNTFYPYPYALAYSEHLLGSAIIGLPLQTLIDHPIAVYGILGLLTFALSGFGAYLLGRRLSGSAWGGLIAGVIFAFCPYKLSQMHHFQSLSTQWMPFMFLVLDRFIERGRGRDLWLFGIFTWLQAMSSIYYALFLVVGLVLFATPRLAWRWRQRLDILWKRALWLALAGALTAGCLLPFFLPYARVVDLMDAGRSLSYVTQLSPDLVNYLAAPPNNWLYGTLTAPLRKEPEGSLLPGIFALGLGALGGLGIFRGSSSPGKVGRRGALLGWLLLTLGAGMLSLGPTIHVAGQALIRGPYILLYRYVPGFSAVRAPGRFAVLVMLGLAALASLGAARVLAGRWTAGRRGIALALIVLIGLEYASFPLPTRQVSAAGGTTVYEWLADRSGDPAVVELPIDQYPTFEHDIRYVTDSTRHWKRLVNGYSGYFPPATWP